MTFDTHAAPVAGTPLRMPRWRSLGRVLSGIALASTAVLSAALAIAVTIGHVHFARILTESMAPEVNRGDALVLAPLKSADIHPGQVVLLTMPNTGGMLYAHRITTVTRAEGRVVVRTKGDANPAQDPWTVTVTSAQVQRVVTVLPLSDIPILQPRRSTLYRLVGLLVGAFLLNRIRVEVSYRRRRRGSATLVTEPA